MNSKSNFPDMTAKKQVQKHTYLKYPHKLLSTSDTYKSSIEANGYRTEMSGLRQHHEIYLNDPRKTPPEKLRTVIRYPIVRV